MEHKAIQDYYPDEMSICYGCGRLNDKGLQIKSIWDEEKEISILEFRPKEYHTAFKGFVYGGLLASLIDCHGTATAAAAAYHKEGRNMDTEPPIRYVTASLKVDYIKPTPIDCILELVGKVTEAKERKTIVEIQLFAKGDLCVKGEVIAVKIPESMIPKS